MAELHPVDHDPFAPQPPSGPLLMPVDHDPYGGYGGYGPTSDSDVAALDPYETIKLRSQLATKGGYTPEQARTNQVETGMGLLYASPIGNALSARDALEAKWRGQELERQGDTEGAKRAFAAAAANTGMAFLPGMGRIGLGRATEGAASSTRIFAGPMAKTANHVALSRAAEMEAQGVHPDEILLATGWGRAADGQWKFEISDHAAKFNMPPKYEGALPADGPAWMRIGNLGDTLEHPDLHDAYSGLASGEVRVSPSAGQTLARYRRAGTEPDAWDQYWFSQKGATADTALHEVQHGIQRLEGFGSGASVGSIREMPVVEDIAQEVVRQMKAKGVDLSEEDLLANARAQVAWKIYHRHAGEVEARNVQTRMNMTPEERRLTPPWATEDVPRDQQIVNFRNAAEQQMASEPGGVDDLRNRALAFAKTMREASPVSPEWHEAAARYRELEQHPDFRAAIARRADPTPVQYGPDTPPSVPIRSAQDGFDEQKIAAATQHFGTTNDFSDAGYILPNGRMLDFSGGTAGGGRTLDHRELLRSDPDQWDRLMTGLDKQSRSVSEDKALWWQRHAASAGLARFVPPDGVEFFSIPTPAQLKTVLRAVQKGDMGESFSLSITDPATGNPIMGQQFSRTNLEQLTDFVRQAQAKLGSK